MGWATLWAIFSQTHLVTLLKRDRTTTIKILHKNDSNIKTVVSQEKAGT
jgi:hypothetical protein